MTSPQISLPEEVSDDSLCDCTVETDENGVQTGNDNEVLIQPVEMSTYTAQATNLCDCLDKLSRIKPEDDCNCVFPRPGKGGRGGKGEGEKQEEDEETKRRKEEQRQIRREKRLEEKLLRKEAMELLRTEIAEKVANGEDLTIVLEKAGVNLKDEAIVAAKATQKEAKRREAVASAKVAMQEKIKQEQTEKLEREEAARPRGPEYWLPLIGSTVMLIGISAFIYRCFNVGCVVRQKFKEISKYITTAFCNEIERRKPKPVYKCRLPTRPKVFVSQKDGEWTVDEIED